MMIHDYQNIPDDVRAKHAKKCQTCKHRKQLAVLVDAHVDWLDCPYDCPNDVDHYFESLKKDGDLL